jgi:UDP-2,3-diacylglucosamine pyrophosphatase LpxH
MKTYKTIFISDIHLGSRGCKADLLCDFLKNNTSENLFLVGDIIDGWRLKKKFYWPQSHTNVIRRILTAAKRDTKVIYIIGNHDEVLRGLLPYDMHFGNIDLVNRYRYQALNGKTYMVIHGDMFDTALRNKLAWLYHFGDNLYTILLGINIVLAKMRNKLGLPYWSLSAYLKSKTKEAVAFMSDFEVLITDYCQKQNADGVICGHVHKADIKKIGDIEYMNDGDWVESCTALVEHHDGSWEIITWIKEKDDVDTDNTSSSYKRLKRRAGASGTDVSGSTDLPAGIKYN